MIQIIHLKKNSKSGILPYSGSENGNVLLIVLMIALVTNILIFSAAFAGRSTMKKSGDSRVNVALLNLAEAGKEDGLARLKSGSVVPVSGSSIPVTSNDNFGGGAYTVSCSSNTTNDRVWLSSVATYTGKTKKIEAIYDITAGSIMSAAFDNAICAGGNITWTGSGNADAGTAMVHCNGSFTISGSSRITANLRVGAQLVRSGSSQIYGHVTTPYTPIQTGSGSITSVTVEPVKAIIIPVLDLTPYYEHALANGQVYSSNQHFTGSSAYVVPGGVMWVNGTFRRSGSGNFTGCVIATGNVDVSGSGNYNKVNEYPIAVSINGDIDFSGSGNVNGLLYAQNGDFEKTGSGNVYGQIICKGNCRKSGSWNFLTFVKSVPVAPGGAGETTFTLVSWREL